jgi:hypothetical protein
MRAIAAFRLNSDTPAFSRFKQVFALIAIFAALRGDSSALLGMTNKAVLPRVRTVITHDLTIYRAECEDQANFMGTDDRR